MAEENLPQEPQLNLYNTLTRSKARFVPIDPDNVRMYVCGPTVYDFAHIGNARPVIVFDVLYRLLRHIYGENHVTYVRNITDVDDKINARAVRDFPDLPLNEAIRRVTEKTAHQFQNDMRALGCLEPSHEPRATEFVLPREDGKADMVSMIQTLLDKGHAYIAEGGHGKEVLFRVNSMGDYGALSNRKLEDQQAGARVAVESHKENPGDFVLWKQSSDSEPGWDGTFNGSVIHGRPGWHIECSAMSEAYLGQTFDIHGGGLDLIFPHHENEIAQSRCCHGTDVMANVWMHNGFLQVEGEKMSKSLGNFHTVNEVLETDKVGGHAWPGDAVRLAMLMTHYREPIDFTSRRLSQAFRELREGTALVSHVFEENNLFDNGSFSDDFSDRLPPVSSELIAELSNDLNLPGAISHLRELRVSVSGYGLKAALQWYSDMSFLGLLDERRFSVLSIGLDVSLDVTKRLRNELNSLRAFSANNNIKSSKSMIAELVADGLTVTTIFPGAWKIRAVELTDEEIQPLIAQRLAFIADKNWGEADRIRDELLAQGIQLKDSKDSQTGERITTWEVVR